jgi:hypothetical protein
MPNAAMYLGSSPVRQSVDIEVGRRCWTYPRKKKEDIIYIKYIYIYMKDVMEERESGDLGGFIYEGRQCQEAQLWGCKAGSNAWRLVLLQ